MSQLTVNRQGPEVFSDNEHSYDDSYVRSVRDYKPPQPRAIDWRVYGTWIVGGLLVFVVFSIVYFVWKAFYCWSGARWQTCQTLDNVEPIAFLFIFLLPILLLIVQVFASIWTNVRYRNGLANKANLVINRYGDQEPADLFDRLTTPEMLDMLEVRYAAATAMERSIAPWKMYRGVNSLSMPNTAHAALSDALSDVDILKPIAIDQWLQWLNERPHVLLGAATGEGKTITAKAILHKRIERGDYLFIIDPHSDDWFGLPLRGGGENWRDVTHAIHQVYDEYKRRMLERDRYLIENGEAMPINMHQPITVLVDEAFLICEAINHGKHNPWHLITEVLGSGARKVNMSVILLSQSTNVEDLDLSGPMRQNFTRVALDARCIKLMIAQEEKEAAQRTSLYESLIGMAYPATTVIDSRVVLLDRTGLKELAEQPINTAINVWQPAASTVVQPNDDVLLAALRKLRQQGYTRKEVRDMGVIFDNELWSKAI